MQWDNHPSGSAGDAVLGDPQDVGRQGMFGCQATLLSIRGFAYFPKPAYKAALFGAIPVNSNQSPNI